VDTLLLFRDIPDCTAPAKNCNKCALRDPTNLGRAGLLWVGGIFYETPADFNAEAARMGVSRRINQVPKDFKLGETWVLLAHRKGIPNGALEMGKEPEFTPAIFRVIRPDRIEVIVDGTESDEVIEGYLKRGLNPVLVVREGNGDPTQDALLDDTAEINGGE
jgi:hypothetical protein